jgi:3-hydroxyacyl-[acyl-carrier-protein] dehydratase
MRIGYPRPMHFDFVDAVLSTSPERIVTVKQVSRAEEYLQDHFASFPVLPGVFMIESLVQAARRLLDAHAPAQANGPTRYVLGGVRAVKYGRFVKPGEALVVTVELFQQTSEGFEFKGQGLVRDATGQLLEDATAVSGRFVMRPIRV